MMDLASRVIASCPGSPMLFFTGQAGFIFRSASGQLLGHDLYLSNCIERVEGKPGFRRLAPTVLRPDELVFDALITSHPHYDHFDIDSLPQMMTGTETRLFASVGCGAAVARTYIEEKKVTYVRPEDKVQCGDFSLLFLPCDHGKAAPDALGVCVETDGRRIVILGDTSYRPDLCSRFAALGPVDVLIAPINGEFGNMDHEECALAAEIIRPGLLIPCHFGLTALHRGDPGAFVHLMQDKYPGQHWWMPSLGDGIRL